MENPLEDNRWVMQFTASDILCIAECAENRVADFYSAAAARFASTSQRDLCLALAGRNRCQARYWSRTLAGLRLTEPTADSVDDSHGLTFQPESMLGLTWLGENPRPRDRLTGSEKDVHILRDAQRRMRDLATFYEGLKGFTANQACVNMIDRVVRMARDQCTGIEKQRLLRTERSASPSVPSPTPISVFLN